MPAGTLTTPFDMSQAALARAVPMGAGAGVETPDPLQSMGSNGYDDETILAMWKEFRQEALQTRHPFQVQWKRNIYYILNRQWIEYIAGRGWRDKRMAPWIPRPVTNKCKETLQAIRSMFASINLGVNVRPNGGEPENVAAASVADELAPLLHEEHDMNQVLNEFDFWLIVTGNAFIHTFVDYDIKHGVVTDSVEACQECQGQFSSSEIADAGNVCPACGGQQFAPAVDESGNPIEPHRSPKGKATTLVLSPLELAFPQSYSKFADVPYVVRMRWRTKSYFENNPKLKTLVDAGTIQWQKSPGDENLNIFHQLSSHNDLGLSTGYMGDSTGSSETDGIVEYECWVKPTGDYPDGLVFRVYGDGPNPIVAHLEDEESIPGPLPYTDADGQPLFTFAHAGYDHVGGRILASGPIDLIVQKQDQLNQLDCMILLIIQRMANPVWLTPKGAEIQKFSGMPGLVLRWNPLTVGGNAKPERIAGEGPHPSLFQIREQYLNDIEQLAGTYDIIKGAKPAGVEAFSALQLLVERSQARFAGVFQSRGDAYRQWFKFAIELERQFGPDERTKAVLTPARTWTFETFKRSQLQGSLSVVVEDGSSTPKTSLGKRAAIQQAASLMLLNVQDPDTQYEALKLFGLTQMVPTLDVQVQAALQKQQAFEKWASVPNQTKQFAMGVQQKEQAYQAGVQQAVQTGSEPPQPPSSSMLDGSPLKLLPWWNPAVHRQELLKWANSDKMRQLFMRDPVAENLVAIHLSEIEQALMKSMAPAGPPGGAPPPQAGAAVAMQNSNVESTQGTQPGGPGGAPVGGS